MARFGGWAIVPLLSQLTYLITTLLSVQFRGLSALPPVGPQGLNAILYLWVIHTSYLRPNKIFPKSIRAIFVRSNATLAGPWCMVKRKLCQVCRQHRPGWYRVCVRCHKRFGPSCIAKCRWNRFLCRPCVSTILLHHLGEVHLVEIILSFRSD